MPDNQVIDEVIGKMNLRAQAAHRFANISIVIIIVVVLSLIAFFYVTPTTIAISGAVESKMDIRTDWVTERPL